MPFMVKALHVTIADKVYDEIEKRRIIERKKNRSEFVEELLRKALGELP